MLQDTLTEKKKNRFFFVLHTLRETDIDCLHD